MTKKKLKKNRASGQKVPRQGERQAVEGGRRSFRYKASYTPEHCQKVGARVRATIVVFGSLWRASRLNEAARTCSPSWFSSRDLCVIIFFHSLPFSLSLSRFLSFSFSLSRFLCNFLGRRGGGMKQTRLDTRIFFRTQRYLKE